MQQKNRPFELAEVQMQARKLSGGVYAVMATDVDETDHTATNAGFVVGDSGVLVIESLSNARLASQVIDEVRKVTSLPIRFRSTPASTAITASETSPSRQRPSSFTTRRPSASSTNDSSRTVLS